MLVRDFAKLTVGSIIANRTRTLLTTLGIAIGIGAVVLLTSIGQGVNRFVVTQFTQFGTNLIQIQPGKTTTMGASLGAVNTVRPLSIDDTLALARLPYIRAAVGFSMGNAEVEGNQRQRRTMVYGTDPGFPNAFSYRVAVGTFLPNDNLHAPRPTAVLGSKMRDELFGDINPLGKFIRIGGSRYRVVGVMETKGQMLGFDLDDTVYVPTARAMELFNNESLLEIDLLYTDGAPVDEVVAGIERLLLARHGSDDVTITTQQQMMDVLGSILRVLTLAVGGLGAISLVVGGIGILTIMTIAVRERTNEIGLIRALGATQRQVMNLFLGEAAVLAALGGVAGLVIGVGGAGLLHLVIPALPVHTPLLYVFLAEAVAVVIGLVAGVLPAHRAAAMTPVDALRAE
ncbi:MAG: ABC transporter permease [Gammaproteobacteria bacterium]